MTTAISSGIEPPAYPPSTPRGQAYPPVSRAQSTRAPRPSTGTNGAVAAAQQLPQRAASHHHHSGSMSSRPSSSARPHDVLPHPQHDYETTNIASSKRSPSKDRYPPISGTADPASRPHRRPSQRTPGQPPLDNGVMPDVPNQRGGGAPASGQPSSHGGSDARRKTGSRAVIPTPSGDWNLYKKIGQGSMGTVRLARKIIDAEGNTEQAACKIIPRGSPDDGQSRTDRERADVSKEIRTAREAAIVGLLQHPHICGLKDVVRTTNHWYMVFEYVNGGQMLDYIISHGKLKEKPARKFSRQIASALDYCHRNSIVHRDLKIENILISKTGDIKIIDFGLSNLFAPKSHLKTFCGSLYFAAPELLQARAYTGPEVDVWSFGIVLYVLVCGKVPFDDQSMPALHAKIKKGVVDYPSWLSSECKNLLSRMLVTDPKQRATMSEVLNHSWMTKGYSGPPENYLPQREPISLPLDQDVIAQMTGFNFGPPDAIKAQLTRLIESEEYQRAVRAYQREKELQPPPKEQEKRRGFGFYRRRNSFSSKDTLTTPSSEGLQIGNDPLNAYHPLISVYHLVREKLDRDANARRVVEAAAAAAAAANKEALPEIAAPREAHTNSSTYEMPGEKATGGRTRARARTHGEDDAPENLKASQLSPTAAMAPDSSRLEPPKKESTAAGLLRRFSTRRKREYERPPEKDRSHPPVVQVHSPAEPTQPPSHSSQSHSPSGLRKSFSIRRSRRDREDQAVATQRIRAGSSQPQHSDLLSPPLSAGPNAQSFKKGLGRSASVNSGEFSRRRAKDPPPTSGSDQSTIHEKGASGGSGSGSGNDRPGASREEQTRPSTTAGGGSSSQQIASRAKSLGHARRESIQARRQRREEANREANVPEETDAEVAGADGGSDQERITDFDLDKPVYLKGLFSVSTTSGKPVREIRAELKRVLRGLGVEYTDIRGGIYCRHSPSIDLKKVADPPNSPGQPSGGGSGHRRRFSFGGLRGSSDNHSNKDDIRENLDRVPPTPRTPGARSGQHLSPGDRSDSGSDLSDGDGRHGGGESSRNNKGVPAGETRTHVRSDMGGSLVLEFQIFIVKVPVISLHGIQFKRLSGNTWQYKNMADQILKELKL